MNALTAVVTGGARGIGLGLAECLARRGASVAITYQQDENAAENARQVIVPQLAEGRRLLALRGDAGDAAAVAAQHREIRQTLGPVNVLVNNAGIMLNAIALAFIDAAGVFVDTSDERREELTSKTVAGRIGRIGDVVRAFEYLLESPFVTGVCLDVTGGAFMI